MTKPPPPDLGVYVHWPFCARICPYCDFNVVRDRGQVDRKAALTDAILADLAAQAELTGPRRLSSVFFGGGTPSLMAAADVARVISAARDHWPAAPDLEVTLEANPTDAETARFAALAEAGVNRLSLGVQSLDDAALSFLGRNHDAAEARRAIATATDRFARVSVDLIYALPDQGVAAWAAELATIAEFGVEHISPYQLTIEAGTAFDRAVRRKRWSPPPDDLAADLYDATQRVLESAGFEAYEVSNHARGEQARSRHNLIYWRGGDYVGVGPGAHGRITRAGARWATEAATGIDDYVAHVRREGRGGPADPLTPRESALERLVMGLRTAEGAPISELAALAIDDDRIAGLAGFVTVAEGRLAVTADGRRVLDFVTRRLADDGPAAIV